MRTMRFTGRVKEFRLGDEPNRIIKPLTGPMPTIPSLCEIALSLQQQANLEYLKENDRAEYIRQILPKESKQRKALNEDQKYFRAYDVLKNHIGKKLTFSGLADKAKLGNLFCERLMLDCHAKGLFSAEKDSRGTFYTINKLPPAP